MDAFPWAAMALLASLALAGCSGGKDVKEFSIHIGKNADGSQYLTPKTMEVDKGARVRFVVTNDDPVGATDSFHDVALLDYDGDGDGILDDIEHEVPAGQTVATSFNGHTYFTATTTGSFKVICEVRRGQPTSHEAAGMWGTLVVA